MHLFRFLLIFFVLAFMLFACGLSDIISFKKNLK